MAEIITDILGAERKGPFNGYAQDYGDGQSHRDGNEPGKAGHCKDHKISRHHEDIAVGEIDQAENAVDQGIADGDQRIGAAKGDPGEALL